MKVISAYTMGFFYVAAGIYHMVNPQVYERMINDFLPFAYALVIASGIAETLLGIGIWFAATRHYAAWGIIALLVVVFPANVNMALHPEQWHVSATILWVRLPLQLLFIYWAYTITKPISLASKN
jgi:uncharacterized membrane protein